MERLTIKTERLEDQQAFLIKAVGSIDTNTVSHLEEKLDHAIESGQRNIVIDLSGVDFIASCGYGLLLSMASELRENNNGDITLLAVPDPTLEMLVTMGVDDFFRMIDSVDEISRIGDPA